MEDGFLVELTLVKLVSKTSTKTVLNHHSHNPKNNQLNVGFIIIQLHNSNRPQLCSSSPYNLRSKVRLKKQLEKLERYANNGGKCMQFFGSYQFWNDLPRFLFYPTGKMYILNTHKHWHELNAQGEKQCYRVRSRDVTYNVHVYCISKFLIIKIRISITLTCTYTQLYSIMILSCLFLYRSKYIIIYIYVRKNIYIIIYIYIRLLLNLYEVSSSIKPFWYRMLGVSCC